MSQRRDSSRHASPVEPDFVDATDFMPAFNAAKRMAAETFGERWDLNPGAYVWARLPAAWAQVRVAGRAAPGLHPPSKFVSASSIDWRTPRERLPDEIIGERWARAPRDTKLPIARFWPSGCLPIGPEYEGASLPLKPAISKRVRDAEPAPKRRPSGIGLASGYERAER